MNERQWTVLLVPEGAGRSRELKVTFRALKVAGTFIAVLAAVAATGIYTAITQAVDRSQLGRLERRNAALEVELANMQVAFGHLSDTVMALTERDRTVRLLAGLPPNDPDIQQAGVGGPSGPLSHTDQLLVESALGRQAVDLREDLNGLIRRARLLSASFQQAVDTMASYQARLERLPSIMPTPGFISSGFSSSRLHPVHHKPLPHLGIDIPAPRGTPILAPARGRVVDVGVQVGYGKIVTLDHGEGIRTRYAHCSEIVVRVGMTVERGDEIALVGRTGVTTNNHLHYEVLINGRQVDPRTFIFGEVVVD